MGFIIAKNITSSGINIPDLSGVYIDAYGQVDLLEFFTLDEIDNSLDLDDAIINDTIIINDGTRDLSKEDSLKNTSLPTVYEVPDEFLDLNDTPTTYSGLNYVFLKVNDEKSGVEFTPINFYDLADIPTYSGHAGELVQINNNESGIDYTHIESILSTASGIRNVIYVAKNGNDSSGTGTYNNPFLSVKKALESITDNDQDNRYIILVAPGVYIEDNPIQLKDYVNLFGIGGMTPSILKAQNSDENLLVGSISEIAGLQLTGTETSSAIYVDSEVLFRLENIVFYDCKDGIHINSSNASVTAYDFTGFTVSGTIDNLVKVSAGQLDVHTFAILGNADINTIFKCEGSNSILKIFNGVFDTSDSVINALYADNSAIIHIQDAEFNNVENVVRVDNGSEIKLIGCSANDSCEKHIFVEDLNSYVYWIGGYLNREKVFYPDGYDNDLLFFQDSVSKTLTVHGDLNIGRVEKGRSVSIGEGASYTRGMVVLTTDNTATSTSDGGNIVDISDNAASTISGTTFGFQGTNANHTILFSSELSSVYDSLDNIKIRGLYINQKLAAVENVKRSFVLEYWNGGMWKEISTMATHSNYFYPYANEIFIRADSEEHIFLSEPSDWAKKTINGKNLYWFRFRIKHNLVSNPVFNYCKLLTSKTKIGRDGYTVYFGLGKFRQTLLGTGNIFGESGGVSSSYVDIGSGGVPTGWYHSMKNNQLNGTGDAIHFQISLPKGICTASPLKIIVVGHPEQSGSSNNGVMKISALPLEVQGVQVADPSGGIMPVSRDLSNTETFNAKQAQVTVYDIPLSTNNKLQSFESDDIDISNYYEGDMVAIRIEFDDDGDCKDYIVWSVEVSGVKWTHGERID